MGAALAKVLFPAFGESGDGQGFFQAGQAVRGVVPGDVEANDQGNGDEVGVAAEEADFVAGGDLSFARDGDIKAGAAAGQEALGHLVVAEFDAELVAGKARLGDNNLGRADGEAVAQVDGIFGQSLGGEILTELAQGKLEAGEFGFPEGVMFEGVAVDGFVFTAVNGEVGLAVAVEIELAEGDAACDGLLEDAGGDGAAVPFDVAGKATVDGEKFHGQGLDAGGERSETCARNAGKKE